MTKIDSLLALTLPRAPPPPRLPPIPLFQFRVGSSTIPVQGCGNWPKTHPFLQGNLAQPRVGFNYPPFWKDKTELIWNHYKNSWEKAMLLSWPVLTLQLQPRKPSTGIPHSPRHKKSCSFRAKHAKPYRLSSEGRSLSLALQGKDRRQEAWADKSHGNLNSLIALLFWGGGMAGMRRKTPSSCPSLRSDPHVCKRSGRPVSNVHARHM